MKEKCSGVQLGESVHKPTVQANLLQDAKDPRPSHTSQVTLQHIRSADQRPAAADQPQCPVLGRCVFFPCATAPQASKAWRLQLCSWIPRVISASCKLVSWCGCLHRNCAPHRHSNAAARAAQCAERPGGVAVVPAGMAATVMPVHRLNTVDLDDEEDGAHDGLAL